MKLETMTYEVINNVAVRNAQTSVVVAGRAGAAWPGQAAQGEEGWQGQPGRALGARENLSQYTHRAAGV